MIIAEKQKRGRGQYGRKWISIKGNLFVSFFYKLQNMRISIAKLTKNNCEIIADATSRLSAIQQDLEHLLERWEELESRVS